MKLDSCTDIPAAEAVQAVLSAAGSTNELGSSAEADEGPVVELQSSRAMIEVPFMRTPREREEMIKDLLTLKDYYPEYVSWCVDVSRAGDVPLSFLGVLRRIDKELVARGGSLVLRIGTLDVKPHLLRGFRLV